MRATIIRYTIWGNSWTYSGQLAGKWWATHRELAGNYNRKPLIEIPMIEIRHRNPKDVGRGRDLSVWEGFTESTNQLRIHPETR